MDSEREGQILQAGLESAREQAEQHAQRAEYPRNINRLYEWLEEEVFDLYGAIYHKKLSKIYSALGEVIFTASEMAEFVKNEIAWESIMLGDAKD